MTEEAAPPGQPAATVTPTAPIVNMVNADGTFTDNWHTMLSDEALHGDQTLPRIKNVESLAKSYVHVRKQVPLDKIARPTDTFSEDDWNEWHTAGGRPETAKDYQMAKPKDWPEAVPWNEEVIGEYQELFHKIGLSSKQVDEIFKYNNQLSLKGHETSEDHRQGCLYKVCKCISRFYRCR